MFEPITISLKVILGDRFNEQLQSVYTKALGYLVAEITKLYDDAGSTKTAASAQPWSQSSAPFQAYTYISLSVASGGGTPERPPPPEIG